MSNHHPHSYLSPQTREARERLALYHEILILKSILPRARFLAFFTKAQAHKYGLLLQRLEDLQTKMARQNNPTQFREGLPVCHSYEWAFGLASFPGLPTNQTATRMDALSMTWLAKMFGYLFLLYLMIAIPINLYYLFTGNL